MMLGLALTAYTSNGAVLGYTSDGSAAVANTEVAVDSQTGSTAATDTNTDAVEYEDATDDNDAVENENENEDCDTKTQSDVPFIDDGSELVSEATISLDAAIATAQTAASGPLDNEVDLERQGDRLVYEIEVGDTEVMVDAQDGSIIATDMNDDADDHEVDDANETDIDDANTD
jgi:uncharacterized membrane protein YkoI